MAIVRAGCASVMNRRPKKKIGRPWDLGVNARVSHKVTTKRRKIGREATKTEVYAKILHQNLNGILVSEMHSVKWMD